MVNCTKAFPLGSGGTGGGVGTIGGSTGAVDNAVIRADGVGGSTIQSSPVIIDDTGVITAPTLTASRLVISDASKNLISNGSITTNAIPKSASSGASLADSSLSDNGSLVTGTLPILTPAGTLANPGIEVGIANYGLYQPAANRLAFSVAGTAAGEWQTDRLLVGSGLTLRSSGLITSSISPLTAGTITTNNNGEIRDFCWKGSWTNAMVTALGAVTAGDVLAVTLPAKTIIRNAYVVINTAAAGTTTLTVALGRTAAAYIDYIVASDAQAAANTVYGDASAERGTNLTGYDLPSFTGTTAVNLHFISTGGNLSAVTTSTGSVYICYSSIS